MKITYSHQGTHAEIPKGDTLAEYAVDAFAFCLNHTGPQFAQAIAEVFDTTEPHNAAIVAHLRAL